MNYLLLLPSDIISYIYQLSFSSYASPLLLSIQSKFNLPFYPKNSLIYSFSFTNKPIDELYYFIINYNIMKKNNMSLELSLFYCNNFLLDNFK